MMSVGDAYAHTAVGLGVSVRGLLDIWSAQSRT